MPPGGQTLGDGTGVQEDYISVFMRASHMQYFTAIASEMTEIIAKNQHFSTSVFQLSPLNGCSVTLQIFRVHIYILSRICVQNFSKIGPKLRPVAQAEKMAE